MESETLTIGSRVYDLDELDAVSVATVQKIEAANDLIEMHRASINLVSIGAKTLLQSLYAHLDARGVAFTQAPASEEPTPEAA